MLCRLAVNVAVTVPVLVRVQLFPLVDEHPLQPPKVIPESGVAVSVTEAVLLNVAWHVPELVPEPAAVQLIPLGELVIVPVPPPAVLMVT
jgi:hypothetical protein